MNKSRILWIALIFSLAVNVFFVGGALYFRFEAEHWRDNRGGVDYVVRELDLSAEQRQALASMQERMRQGWDDQREKRAGDRRAMFELLVQPEFPEDELRALLEAHGMERTERFLDMGRNMHAFIQTLSPGQQEEMLEMMQDRRFWRGMMGWGGRKRD
jgi:Spy/CpxP family protein refolding chaperone